MATQEHFTIKLFLYEIEPLIWRRLTVPADFTFGQLHQAIQKAMGWEDLQDHEFLHGKGKKLDQIIGAANNDHAKSAFFQNEDKIVLGTFIGRKKLPLRILYRYDFAEEWVHEIVIEGKEENSNGSPVLLEGERACPPEDSGGAWEYKACLDGESEWMDPRYDPESFDPDKVQF